MKHKSMITSLTILIVLFLGLGIATAQEPEPGGDIGAQAAVGTGFTYQGRLTDGGSPANGEYDFRFRLYNAGSGGSQVGGTVNRNDVTVTDGLFTVELSFGGVFDGTAYWLDIRIRPGSSSGAYTALTPRQPLTPAPYALSLRPGASIVGSLGMAGILDIMNSDGAGDGLRVSAGDDGMYVSSAGNNGVRVQSAGGVGVYVASAGDDGVYVDSAGSPSTTRPSTLYKNGFEVAGAEGDGLFVGQADDDGVEVGYTGGVGVRVGSTGGDGVHVALAGDDGVAVTRAGNPGTYYFSNASNGFEVDGAGGNGLWVGRAEDDGVYVYSAGGDAGYFNGSVVVTGNLSKGGGSFKIDHPLDPENQYLHHSFVESPDMMNVYNGNVTLDANGEAWISLPDWFEALNRDFRYQLTPIGRPGPGLYIAEKIQHNRFKIGGGEPGLEVSWQVTGIRHDPYAETNRIPVEEEKPAEERGAYLHPEAYGQPETMGLAYRETQAHEANQPAAGR